MNILASLAKAYERLPEAPVFGFSMQKIGFLISLNADGAVANITDLREGDGKKKTSQLMPVPQAAKRTVGIAPNFLWDKTPYVLGVTAGEGKRVVAEHAAFVKRHLDALSEQDDEGLKALSKFLTAWRPDQFIAPVWPDDMKDQNVVFALETDRLKNIRIHDRPAAKALWEKFSAEGEKNSAVCLVSGNNAPVARLHQAIKGVWGAQSSGASIVSFNLDAFTSYGHEQGDNAPVSEVAAFAYTTALNRFLEKGSRHRIQIGDASTVFWADASNMAAAQEVESLFFQFAEPSVDDEIETKKIGITLSRIRNGEPLKIVAPELAEGVRFHVLGLAPNAARISIRFYLEDDFGKIAESYQRFVEDMRIEPPPRNAYPPLWQYLCETAVMGKRENVPPKLGGEWMRSILTGTTYPLTLLSNVLMRIRSDKEINAMRVAILKAVLIRNFHLAKEAPVALDLNNKNKGYLLGRLFAAFEHVQAAALGSKVNATIKDKFYGAASAQPRKVFALLDKGAANHLSKVGKQKPGYKVVLEKSIAAIMGVMEPGEDPFPASLSAQEQALFSLGYYHQRSEYFHKNTDEGSNGEKIQ